tara:strand:- start:422 stop:2068 length:1647 start_codon:yes stop_codon:yes gene_type:complete
MKEATIAERFNKLESKRTAKLERSRYCASLSVPSLLPPSGWTEESQLPQPFSSVTARGVTAMASRMLSALLPLNDMPFFKFEMNTGMEPDEDIRVYLEALSYQVYNKLSSKNLRETLYQVLQHLIVVGDILLIMEDDFSYRLIRLDQFVVRRDVNGDAKEIIHLDFVANDNDSEYVDAFYNDSTEFNRTGYETIYCRCWHDEDAGVWKCRKEDSDGNLIMEGEWKVSPYVCLRWSGVAGENYGRSHCEDLIGDIRSLEAFTEGLIYGTAASSSFWVGIDPAGITEIDDIHDAHKGAFVPARQQDVFTISPAATMTPQLQATQSGVENMRREIGQAFLLNSASIPEGDRVTATAVRAIGQELENVLGGAFSSIARNLMKPLVSRAVYLMLDNQEIDPRMEAEFTEDGELTVEIVTGLQALSRDSDLQKLMQMGEMVRNLPEPAIANFRWESYGRALISSLGFNPDNWVKSEEQIMQEQQAMQQEQMAMQQQMQAQAGVQEMMQQAAAQDIQQNGGAGINQLMGQMDQGSPMPEGADEIPPEIAAMMGGR